MGFNEKVHAYIAAKFYGHLTEKFGQRGEAAFLHATRYYAEQRGRRMAQRAIRDGQPLTYETYCRYGEWVSTEELKELGVANQSAVETFSPDFEVHIRVCPWHAQFKEMGLVKAGVLYCSDLDASICRGFNPKINFKTLQSLHDHDYCIQVVKDSGLKEGDQPVKRPEGLKSFEYHCAHSYWSYSEVTASIFGAEGEAVNAEILKEFGQDYGQDMADTLAGYKYTNFNVI